jgi:hypothetical protein
LLDVLRREFRIGQQRQLEDVVNGRGFAAGQLLLTREYTDLVKE